jgi:small conductance mechanosensitive channel
MTRPSSGCPFLRGAALAVCQFLCAVYPARAGVDAPPTSPLSQVSFWRWLIERGPRVAVIFAGMAGLLWLARAVRGRLVAFLTLTPRRGTPQERENRARTLVSVFSNAATVAIFIGGCLMILSELGVNIVPLVGGAAVAGLAVAFGAQNLIRDYFSGFMILLENQYGINDVIRICGVSGQVERVTLRVTVLRDHEGAIHFIPNGQITTVTNMTSEWSRAVIEVGVAQKEDVDRVMSIIVDVGRALRADVAWGGDVLEDLQMEGLDRLGDGAAIVRFGLKTRPGRQWQIRREMLRRITMKFAESGIELAPPLRFHPSQATPGT